MEIIPQRLSLVCISYCVCHPKHCPAAEAMVYVLVDCKDCISLLSVSGVV
jgi:hypothetical protein